MDFRYLQAHIEGPANPDWSWALWGEFILPKDYMCYSNGLRQLAGGMSLKSHRQGGLCRRGSGVRTPDFERVSSFRIRIMFLRRVRRRWREGLYWYDVVCVPSTAPDPLSRSVMEAMGHGLTVVAVPSGGISRNDSPWREWLFGQRRAGVHSHREAVAGRVRTSWRDRPWRARTLYLNVRA